MIKKFGLRDGTCLHVVDLGLILSSTHGSSGAQAGVSLNTELGGGSEQHLVWPPNKIKPNTFWVVFLVFLGFNFVFPIGPYIIRYWCMTYSKVKTKQNKTLSYYLVQVA